MSSVGLGARVLLALMFAVAAVGKLADQPGTREALKEFRLPLRSLAFSSLALPLVELLTAAALLVQPSARWGALAAIALLALFAVGVASAMARGESPDCHCFGQLHSAPAGAGTLLRNGLLAVPAAFVLTNGPGTSLGSWLPSHAVADIVALIAPVAAVALAALGFQLRQQNRRLRRDLERVREATKDFPPGPPIGVRAPRFSLPDVEGNAVSLNQLLTTARPVAMVFVTPQCESCQLMFPTLADWQRRLAHRITIVIVGKGDARELRAVAKAEGLRNVLVDAESEVFEAYRVLTAPSAVILTSDGRVGSAMHSTTQIVEALLRRTLLQLDAGRGSSPERSDGGPIRVVRWAARSGA